VISKAPEGHGGQASDVASNGGGREKGGASSSKLKHDDDNKASKQQQDKKQAKPSRQRPQQLRRQRSSKAAAYKYNLCLYIQMEHCDGGTLQDHLRHPDRRVDIEDVVSKLLQIAKGELERAGGR
jgi:hypothetical protein